MTYTIRSNTYMRRRTPFMVMLLAIMVLLTLKVTAQEEPAPVQSIEELYLSRPVTVSAAEAMIASNDRETQRMALRMLAESADKGTVDAESAEYVELMSRVLRQGVTTISRNGSRLPDSYHPLLRMEAARALARSNTPEAARHLTAAIRNDVEPRVVGEAMVALSTNDHVEPAIGSVEVAVALRREANLRGDEVTLLSGLNALQTLARRAGEDALDLMVRETVVSIAAGGYNRQIRQAAIGALAQM